MITKFFFFNKSNFYKLLSLIGLLCLIKGISGYDFYLGEYLDIIFTMYGTIYVGFKFLLLLLQFFLFRTNCSNNKKTKNPRVILCE